MNSPALASRSFTLTTVNIPIGKELLIRSLMPILNLKTKDRWSFVDEDAADAVVCSPLSTSPSLVRIRSKHSQDTPCVSLVSKGENSIAGTELLVYPIKANEFARVLDALSDRLTASERSRSFHPILGKTGSIAAAPSNHAFRLAFTLRELLKLRSPNLYRIVANGIEFHLVPASGTLFQNHPLDNVAIARLLSAETEIQVTQIVEEASRNAATHDVATLHIDSLLWRLGLEGDDRNLVPGLPATGHFVLRHWPNFGRVPHDRFHLRMASVLARGPKTLAELAQASAVDIMDARKFVNACSFFGLVEVRPAPRVPADNQDNQHSRLQQNRSARRFSGVLDSIRSALGFGAN